MQYVVRMITNTQFCERDGKVREHTTFKYVPAFNRTDAEHMAEMLNKTMHHHQEGGTRVRRNWDVCITVWNGRENIYLDQSTVEQIASEYTNPAERQAAE